MRPGFALIEVVIALALVAILTSLVAPSLTAAADRGAIRMGLAQLSGAHREARLAAMLENRVALLSIDSTSITLRTVAGIDTALRWRRNGPTAWGVHLIGPRRSFTFAPSGYSIGVSNGTLRIERGSAGGALIISRLGRVRVDMW